MKKQEKIKKVVLIDGDIFRDVFENDLGYSLSDRKKNANRISRFCKMLDDQNINVVCGILSIFSETRAWNRKFIDNYYEVFIDAMIDQIKKRDYKGLYKDYNDGKIKNIVGMDIEFKKPKKSDLIIKNDNSKNKLISKSNFLSSLLK